MPLLPTALLICDLALCAVIFVWSIAGIAHAVLALRLLRRELAGGDRAPLWAYGLEQRRTQGRPRSLTWRRTMEA